LELLPAAQCALQTFKTKAFNTYAALSKAGKCGWSIRSQISK